MVLLTRRSSPSASRETLPFWPTRPWRRACSPASTPASRTVRRASRAAATLTSREAGCEQQLFETLAALKRIAEAQQMTMAQLSLAWLRQKAPTTIVVAGRRGEA